MLSGIRQLTTNCLATIPLHLECNSKNYLEKNMNIVCCIESITYIILKNYFIL